MWIELPLFRPVKVILSIPTTAVLRGLMPAPPPPQTGLDAAGWREPRGRGCGRVGHAEEVLSTWPKVVFLVFPKGKEGPSSPEQTPLSTACRSPPPLLQAALF